jgi:hygromycin-B 4-O-kinase
MSAITLDQAETFLADRFGVQLGTVETIQPGAWSTVFAYTDRGQERIIRFSHHLDDLEHDQRAAAWSTTAMPVPRMLELGTAFDRHYAIAERVPGGFIDHLDGQGFRAILPALFAMLDDMRETDISNTVGFGGWDSNGHGSSTTWRDYLLRVGVDHPNGRGHGWRKALARSAIGDTGFETALDGLDRLVEHIPDDRHLIHSDLLNRNMLVADNHITGVIDWGCSLYGDFLYDIAWFAYYWPWFPAWHEVNFLAEVQSHYERTGLDVPNFHERIRCYQVHIGLGSQAYNASIGNWDNVRADAERTLTLLESCP